MANQGIANLKVLVVDDDAFMLEVISATLNGIGIENVETASSGPDALVLLQKSEPGFDVVMCDLYMPNMDGIEFLDHVKGSGFDGSLILFSGVNPQMLEQAKLLAAAKQINILGCLEKPIAHEELEKLLSQDR